MKPSRERFILYTIAITDGSDLEEFSDVVEFLREAMGKVEICYNKTTK